jgi:apolipoprotein N-acyltransferase
MNVVLLLFSGIVLGIGFAPLPLGLLTFVGFLPLLVVLERTSGIGQTLRRLYVAFFAFHGASNWWVSSWQREADPYLMVAGLALWLGHPFFFAVPMLAYKLIRDKRGRAQALAALPFLWTAFEWLHSLGELSYPWQALGYTQIYHTPLAQIADVTGVWGLTFIVVAVNSCVAHVWFVYAEDVEQQDVEQHSAKQANTTLIRLGRTMTRSRVQVVAVVGLLFVPLVYGVWRVSVFQHQSLLADNRVLTVGIIQPNINPWGKWQGGAHAQVLLQEQIQDSLNAALQNASAGKQREQRLQLALWSETAVPYRILAPANGLYWSGLQHWVDTSGTALITGLPSDTVYASRQTAPPSAYMMPRSYDTLYVDSYNSATILYPHSSVPSIPPSAQVYRKMKLTPFAERVPYADAVGFLVKALTWGVGISGWQIGNKQFSLALPLTATDTTRIGTIICIESIYPDFVAGFVRSGAELLTVQTNDGWFNFTPGPHQHYAIAAMRAIETRRYVVRCANTGISGFITPLGTSLQQTRIDTRLGIAERVPLLQVQTLYVRLGDWLPKACALLALLWIVLAVRGNAPASGNTL